jgi:hypothetical protein
VALVEFAGSVALMAVGDEAAGASAGKSAEAAGKAAVEAAKVGGQAAKMSKTMKDLANAMKQLKKTGEALIKTYKFINEIVKAAKNIQGASKFDDLKLPSADDISSQAEWDVFRLKVDNMMKKVIDAGIDGARAYNEELDKLAIYGKALSANQASLIQSAQEVARLYMQKHVSDAMQNSLDQAVQRLKQGMKPDDTMMHLLYVRGLNIKRWLYIALQNYIRAYRYWALRDSLVTPSITKSVQEMKEDLAKIKQDYANALVRLIRRPRTLAYINKVRSSRSPTRLFLKS